MASFPSKPTFLVIPGAYHTPWHYSLIVSQLQALGYSARSIANLSNHDEPPFTQTWQDDAKNIAAVITEEASQGREVILVMHSYGGAPGSSACKGLLVPDRQAKGLKGGVGKLVYMASFALAEGGGFGEALANPDLVSHDNGSSTWTNCDSAFFQDVPEPLKSEAFTNLVRQAQGAHYVSQNFTPWKHVPATYIICEQDKALPPAAQKFMASQEGGLWSTVSLDVGHSPFLVCPEKVVEILVEIAEGGKKADSSVL